MPTVKIRPEKQLDVATEPRKNHTMPTIEYKRTMQSMSRSLKGLYGMEKKLVHRLPVLEKYASSEQVKLSIKNNVQTTRGQVSRLEAIFDMLNQPVQGVEPKRTVEILTTDSPRFLSLKTAKSRDINLIRAAQKIKIKKIRLYTELAAKAKRVGLNEIEQIFTVAMEDESKNSFHY